MMIEDNKTFNINRIAVLYRDLLSSTVHQLSDEDKNVLLGIKPINKIVSVGDIDSSNWNAYPLAYMLHNKLVAPTVLDESKIYQSWHAMRTHDESILHPQALVSQCVIIRIIGLDNSQNINDYMNSFINMCIASDQCKLIFVIIDGDKKFYKNSIYTRKCNSSFIDINSADKRPYTIESTPLCIKPDDITFFNYSRKDKLHSVKTQNQAVSVKSTISSRKNNSISSMITDSDFI